MQTASRVVSPGYFEALGIRVIDGRAFDARDSISSLPVIVVNRAFARRYLPEHPVGRRLPANLSEGHPDWEIAGIVDDVLTGPALTDPAQPELYAPQAQLPDGIGTQPIFAVRTTGDPAWLRLYAVVLTGFAGFALAIAGVSLFGTLSCGVAQRSKKIGVRAALGARPKQIVAMVVREGLVIPAAGMLVGLAASYVLARSISTFLFGITAHDGITFVIVPLVLLAVSVIACAVPARRAAKVDPLTVLRSI